MAGEAYGNKNKAESVNRINLFTDAGQFNPSVTGGGAFRAVPEAAVHQQPNQAMQAATGSPAAQRIVSRAVAGYNEVQTNPGSPVAPAGTAAWRSGADSGVGPPAGAR